jgi:hypothetical protein
VFLTKPAFCRTGLIRKFAFSTPEPAGEMGTIDSTSTIIMYQMAVVTMGTKFIEDKKAKDVLIN